MYEIERKFLVKTLPQEILNTCSNKIIQGYLYDNPVLRIRKYANKYFFTYKGSGLLKRKEIEIEISNKTFDNLISKCSEIIIKDRYHINYNSYTIYIDIFKNTLNGLILAEVEFNSITDAKNFIPPSYLTIDVTSNPSFQNVNLKGKTYEQIIENIRI